MAAAGAGDDRQDVGGQRTFEPQAVALAARERGQRVLLVEVAAPVEAGRLLGGAPSMGREIEVLPGHGPATTIGRERRTNPFLQGLA